MENVCQKCGLPKELCTCETMVREAQRIKVYIITRKFKKPITVIEGMGKDVDKKEIARELKSKFACGGTVKDDIIELQGNHKDKVKAILIKLGFNGEQIDVR